ncbi:hypothetical protein [Geoalkalibacter halelectricus]|uniref:hypothetical protein n=1 Tax=Geoalkalibacter halelectricus TaxID=2847045 RepID=UPI003D1FC293
MDSSNTRLTALNSPKRRKGMSRGIAIVLSLVVFLAACAAPPSRDQRTEPTGVERQVRQVLGDLISAYENKDPRRFAEHISPRYFNDKARLEIRVRRDFNALSDIRIRPEITSVVSDGMGRIFVELDFSRSHTFLATNENITETGRASLIFHIENGTPRLVSQRPALFGIN